MYTKNLSINELQRKKVDMSKEAEGSKKRAYRCKGKVVEDLRAIFPSVRVSVFLLAFIIKTVHLGDLSALVVASQECDFVRVSIGGMKGVGTETKKRDSWRVTSP